MKTYEYLNPILTGCDYNNLHLYKIGIIGIVASTGIYTSDEIGGWETLDIYTLPTGWRTVGHNSYAQYAQEGSDSPMWIMVNYNGSQKICIRNNSPSSKIANNLRCSITYVIDPNL